MIKPFLQDDAFLADVHRISQKDAGLHLWWLGQSGFLVAAQGHFLLLDPYLSDSLTKKYSSTDKPHVRMTELVIAPERLGFVEMVTSTHNHTDHLDAETLRPLLRANPQLQILTPEANREFAAQRLGIEPARLTGINAGEHRDLGVFKIHAVPAAHEALERDASGRYVYLGYVIEVAGQKIYHSGDTILYDGMVDWLKPFAVDVALLPINGRAPERRVAGNLWGREAAWLARQIGARCLIPCHYDMFEFNTASPEEFIRACETAGQPYRVLLAGERWDG